MNKFDKYFSGIMSLLAISIINGVLNGGSVYAGNTTTDTTSIAIDTSCSVIANVTSEHSISMTAGTYSGATYPDGVGSTTIKTFCNDKSGYGIYAIGYSDNELGNTNLTNPDTSAGVIATGTATSGNTSNWAMKVSAVAGTYAPTIMNGFDTFSAVPSTYVNVAKLDHATDSSAGTNIGSSITTTYAVYISDSQLPGTYTGQVKYILVHPDYSENSSYVMQDIAEWEDELLPGVPVTATDSRDGNTYSVAKLSDGNIWMTKNLDLAGGTTLVPATSNVMSSYTLPASSTSGFSDDNTAYVYNSNSTTCGDNSPCYSYYSYVAATAGANPSTGNANSDICPKGWRLPTKAEYDTLTSIYTTGAALTTAPWNGVYAGSYSNGSLLNGGSYGYYWSSTADNSSSAYSFYFNSSSANTHSISKRYGDSVRCIANNKPSYAQTVEVRYQNADGTYGNYSTYNACTADIMEGTTYSCTIPGTEEYQTTTLAEYTVEGTATKQVSIDRNTNTVSLTAGTGVSSVSVTGSGVKTGSGTGSATVYYGGDISIAATMSSSEYDFTNWTGSTTYTNNPQSISNITSNLSFTANGALNCQASISGTMQAFNPSGLCSSVTSGTLTDARGDNQTYTVAKLTDGKWWMLDNLALGSTSAITLTNANTNMTASSWTLPASGEPSGYTSFYTAPYIIADEKNTIPSNAPSGSLGNNKVGVYYNYCAVTVGTICPGDYEGSSATSDICPKGWRLPAGDVANAGATNTDTEYWNLYVAYNSNYADFRKALSLPYSGYNKFGGIREKGSVGLFWSATHVYGDLNANLKIRSEKNAIVQEDGGYDEGKSVRCILK